MRLKKVIGVFLLLFFVAATVHSAETYVVGVGSLNFRKEASLKSGFTGVVRKGEALTKVGESYNETEKLNWYKVRRKNGQEGWVSAKYLKPVSAAIDKKDSQKTDVSPLRKPVKEIRAAFVYVGPVGDHGWTFEHDRGRKEMAKLPFVKETTYVDSVEKEEDTNAAIRRFASKGYNLIFTTSYEHLKPTIEVAKEFKNVIFMHCSGDKRTENLGTYFGRIHDPKYLAGIIAGKMTQSGKIGYVAPFDHIPEVIRGINSFVLGARSVNPKAEIRVKWTKSWYDEAVERKSAEALADEGADVLSMQQDSPETLKVAEERGKYAIGYNSDMKRFAPNAYLTSPIWNWGVLYKDIAEKVHKGTWKSEDIWWGMDKELVGLAPISDKVPADVKALVEKRKAEIISGKFHVFTGPIRDEKGNLIVSEGKVMTDAELLQMKFFVEGVK